MKLFAVVILLIYVSCGEKPVHSGTVIKIDLEESSGANFSDFFSSIEYVLLDFPDSLPLVFPYKFQFTEDEIVVRDMDTDNLFFFNTTGQISGVIASTGKGPGEFFQMDDFKIRDDRIFIQDTYLKKIVEYDRDGRILLVHKNIFKNNNFYAGDNYFLFFLNYKTEYGGYNFIRKDKNSDQYEGFVDIKKSLEKIGDYDSHNGFRKLPSSDVVCFALPYTTEVVFFKESNGQLIDHIRFDLGKWVIDDQLRYKPRTELNEHLREMNMVEKVNTFCPIGNHFFMHGKQGEKSQHFIFLDEKLKVIHQFLNPINDIDGLPLTFPWTTSNEHVVFLKRSSQFYNEYLEKFSGQQVTISPESVHAFFQTNKEDLKDDKWVLVKARYKAYTE